MQLQASAVQPDPTQYFVSQDMRFGIRRKEAVIQSQGAESTNFIKDLEATQDS